ncbi:triphosphoribosyl-dephospho-CoA synthase MdcB [Massilia sp. S19_KUP03_FR1]|uniref:triphosphoribosyl-dephospho-CoA synthase MdcB n=1 Tax=Massilia sp. S19_KUP03_FR1 TaxID=3025503 RepID=UPI002FCDBBF4
MMRTDTPVDTALAADIARIAVGSLYAELVLYPKPGLVSLVDNGSHSDMQAATFMRSLFTLRHYFGHVFQAGRDDAPFARLRTLGIDAERRMMLATSGINTHRGAIFSLGLLCAAVGRASSQGLQMTPAALRAVLLICWGEALAGHAHGARGAREEGALGLPSVFDVGVPALQATLAAGRSMRHARVDALFALMAQIDDTNVVHRGGLAGARTVRAGARAFVDAGGTAQADWMERAVALHHNFIGARLSPGGAADLLAATCFVHSACTRGAP